MRRKDPPNSRANRRVPPGLRSRPREQWRPENRDFPEEYAAWLIGGGISPSTVHSYHLPLVHLVLGLVDRPWYEIDPDSDFLIVMEHYRARSLCPRSLLDRRGQLHQLARFLRQRRGEPDPPNTRPLNLPVYFAGLPEWLTGAVLAYGKACERRWRPSRIHQRWIEYLGHATCFWRWLFAQRKLSTLAELCRADLLAFLEQCMAQGHTASTANVRLLALQQFLRYLQEEGWMVPEEVFRIRPFPQPQPLPRYLTDEEVTRLQEDYERAAREANTPNARRDSLLDRACFYLLWHGGLRPNEVIDLLLDDLDLGGKRLRVQGSKGGTDRTIYLTTAAVDALRDYLAVRGEGPSRHVFLYRHRPLAKDLVRGRLKAKGHILGIRVYPYRLRHTFATQLLNAGARLETIQYLLGHRHLRTTQVYARVHDQTVASDYYRAMAEVEQRLALEAGESDLPYALWPQLETLLAEVVRATGDPVRQGALVAEMRHWFALGARLSRKWDGTDRRWNVAPQREPAESIVSP